MPPEESPNWVEQKVQDGADWVADAIAERIAEGLMLFCRNLLEAIDSYSTEIITLGMIVCAGGMMLGPMLGDHPGKWWGRLVAVFWAGVIWKLVMGNDH